MTDIIIIGGGPAGLTAAVYALRAGKSVLIIEKGAFGGQITYSPKVENFPSVKEISGNELAERMVDAAIALGAEFESDSALSIKTADGVHTVICEGGAYDCHAVIIAVGVTHRHLGLEREESLIGAGVSFCAVCDGAFYKGSSVAVAGGGNTALQEAMYLSDFCEKVYVIECMPSFTGEAALLTKLSKKTNVELLNGTSITSLYGENELTAIGISVQGVQRKLNVDALFIAIGLKTENEAFADVATVDEYGYFNSDEGCGTVTDGVFVAGDCRNKTVRQLTTACADGSVAAIAACRYIDGIG